MVRLSVLIFVVCFHANCFCGGEGNEEQNLAFPVYQQPPQYSILAVVDKIKQCIPSVPRRVQLLKEDELLYKAYSKEIENGLDEQQRGHLKDFCNGKRELLASSCAILVKLLQEVQDRKKKEKIYNGYDPLLYDCIIAR